MRVLFVEHDHVSPAGPVGDRFAERGFDIEELVVVPHEQRAAPGVEVDFPDPSAYDVVVPMGSPWSVYDESLIGSWVKPELAFLRRAHEQRVSVLGICFGGQALAAALGGAVLPAAQAEIGWYTVETSAPEVIEPGPWFQWHQDRWQPPPEARTLARSAVGGQAFVVGTSLGVQFHPELTPAMLAGWLDNGGAEYLRARGLDVAALVAETDAQASAARQRAHRLVDRFLDVVARPSTAAAVRDRAGL